MACYALTERNEVLPQDATWMNFENIMLCERNQTQRNTKSVAPFM